MKSSGDISAKNFAKAKFQKKEDAMLLVTDFATVLEIVNHCQISCWIIKCCYTWVNICDVTIRSLLLNGNTSDFTDHSLPKDSVSAHGASHHAWAPHLNPVLRTATKVNTTNTRLDLFIASWITTHLICNSCRFTAVCSTGNNQVLSIKSKYGGVQI